MIDVSERVLDLAIQIQRIPAPTFHEARRARYLRKIFINEGLVNVEIDDISNVFARLPGTGQARPLVVSAHSDTVFPEDTDLSSRRAEQRIYGPGIGDNCLGVAGLIGLIWMFKREKIKLPGDLWLVANVGEEGLGDLRGMRAVVDRFGETPQAYLILEGMALGQIYHRALGVQRYRIAVKTPGGHSWADYGKPSAISELATIIEKLNQLALPEEPRTTLNVGVIEGGFSVNTIAAQASLELDLRSEDTEALKKLVESVETLVEQANLPEVQVDAEIIGHRPAGKIPTQHPLVQLAAQALQAQKLQPQFMIGSTDANIPLSRNFPAITIGLTIGKGAHTLDEYILTEPLEKGLDHLLDIVSGAFQAQ
jgi:acetylornithine deacetylase/succinyl-diaminopimelate desuccinylase-like protein